MQVKTRPHVLDCTLRDGGYYIRWDFPVPLVSKYFHAIKASGIEAVEIGFRNLPQEGFFGAFAYTTDDFLDNLSLPEGLKIAVMLNAKEILAYPTGIESALAQLFKHRSCSKVSLVRLAVYPDQAFACQPIADYLKKLGYELTFNLMQVTDISLERLKEISRLVKSWGTVDVFYFADSLGNISIKLINEIVSILKKDWAYSVGIHAHDNMGQALANTLTALEAGVTWVDGTVLGMGRGAGNACTELLLLELKQMSRGSYFPDALFPLVMEDFEELRAKYKWGPNLLYYLSGMYGIHPTYVQEILGKGRREADQIISALEFLGSAKSNKFDDDNLAKAMTSSHVSPEGSWTATDWVKGKDILILGSGPGGDRYSNEIVRFIEAANPIVISLNINKHIPAKYISAYAACHKTRLLIDSEKYESLKKPIFVPMNSVPDLIKSKLQKLEVLDYGMATQEGEFKVFPTGCIIPFSLVVAYVLALSVAGGARKILLVGFDGYETSDPRHDEMERLLELYRTIPNSIHLVALTPTTYSITQSSVFCPTIPQENPAQGRGLI